MTLTSSDLSHPTSVAFTFSYDVLKDIYTNAENPLLPVKGVPTILKTLFDYGIPVTLKTHDGSEAFRLTGINEESFTVERQQADSAT